MSEFSNVGKELLVDQYEEHKEAAQTHLENGREHEAAKSYLKAAEASESIAEYEQDEVLQQKRLDLSRKMRRAASDLVENPGGDEDVPGSVETQTTGVQGSEGLEFDKPVPGKSFEDLAGMTGLKDTFHRKIIQPLEHPEIYKSLDIGVVNGFILYGPPGTGKTHSAECLAGELGFNFFTAGSAELTSSLVGETPELIHQLFSEAISAQPSLVFVDELDDVVPDRGDAANSSHGYVQSVNQFLKELTRIQDEDVIFLGATNRIGSVDEAVKGSHRVQELIEVPLPDAEARKELFQHFLNRRSIASTVDLERLVEASQGFSAADIETVCMEAARHAADRALEQGIEVEEVEVTKTDLEKVLSCQ
ncbi:ATP-binding protein [Halobacteria archaeon AArc-curdl1]|uniref:ATP-binding protein n=1 Tax=Natronosalvus hydrolyticus TaxID=2979988 RepID=A0AAP3E7C2_9EURY|nr:ATP-binding protein [Halobacteria archaeon AArc-curdl1]